MRMWAVPSCLAAASLACGPSVKTFGVLPNQTCSGSPVQLTWSASRGGRITATPPMNLPRMVDETGSLRVVPVENTKFHLEVSNLFGHDGRDADVTVNTSPGPPKPLGESVADPSAGCDRTNVWVTAKAPADFWDTRLKVARIGSHDGRTYTVEHAGISSAISTDRPSSAFATQAVAGPWKLTTPLVAGEVCGHNTPKTLVIDLYPTCAP